MWYNSITKELSSTSPWGTTYLHPDLRTELYSDWGQVEE